MTSGANLVPPRFNMQQVVKHLHLRSDFYEPFERYQPGDAFFKIIEAQIPLTSRILREAFWTHVQPLGGEVPMQGWKIHVSATQKNAPSILSKVAEICCAARVPFKFASDPFVLSLLLGKGCARGSSGKFMTIYPQDEQQARLLLEELYTSLQSFEGPYVLSDRRFRDCSVLYYRYGGFTPITRRDADGLLTSYLMRPDLQLEPDDRTPYFQVPDWLQDPFQTEESEEGASERLNGRYEVLTVLSYSNSGGVYKAVDHQTGKTVVVKEARPHVDTSASGQDAIEQLKKEFQLLTHLCGLGIAPEPIETFTEWEHLFLVQEFVPGESLHAFTGKYSPVICTSHTEEELQAWWKLLRSVAAAILHTVRILHAQGVVFGDLSLNNVLVSVEDGQCVSARLIDFEGASRPNVDAAVNMFTPGFARPGRTTRQHTTLADDHYALGALLFSLLLPVAVLTNVKADALPTFLDNFADDFGLPPVFGEVVNRLLAADDSLNLNELTTLLDQDNSPLGLPGILSAPRALSQDKLRRTVRGALKYAVASADFGRQDRLFPSSPQQTHSLGLDHGALGVALTLQTVQGRIPQAVRQWIREQPVGAGTAPGLFGGLAGMAVGFAQIGERKSAERAYRLARRHDHLYARVHLHGGVSGFGLASLTLFLQWGDAAYLQEARHIGDLLDTTAQWAGDRVTWPDFGSQEVGLGYGQSGVALFLLYLHAVTGEARYLRLGEAALAEDLAHGRALDGGALGFPDRPDGKILYPYWMTGSAGVGSVLVRYYHVTKNPAYRELTERIRQATTPQYSVFPSLFMGLAGLGMFLIDAEQFLGDPTYLKQAHGTAKGVLRFSVDKPQGTAFPGDYLHRISTDLGSGSSGIAMFLHRLAQGTSNPLFPDAALLRAEGVQ